MNDNLSSRLRDGTISLSLALQRLNQAADRIEDLETEIVRLKQRVEILKAKNAKLEHAVIEDGGG
jgi:cell division protein FtsB